MKTSSKLLIGLLVAIVLINIYVIVMVRVHLEAGNRNESLPDLSYLKELETQQKNVSHFNKIMIDFPCRVFYNMTDTNSLTIKASKDAVKKIEVKDFNGQLILTWKKQKLNNEMIYVELASDSLVDILLKNGVRFESDEINVSALNITATNSLFNAYVNTKHLGLNLSSHSMATVEGVTDYINVMAESNSVLDTSALTINYR